MFLLDVEQSSNGVRKEYVLCDVCEVPKSSKKQERRSSHVAVETKNKEMKTSKKESQYSLQAHYEDNAEKLSDKEISRIITTIEPLTKNSMIELVAYENFEKGDKAQEKITLNRLRMLRETIQLNGLSSSILPARVEDSKGSKSIENTISIEIKRKAKK